MSKHALALVVLLLAACSLGPATRDVPVVYDLGAPHGYPAGPPRVQASVLLYNVAAPGWLDTPAIVYRLNYQDAARQQTYANSRWAMQPALLLTQRLRGRLVAASDAGVIGVADGARAAYTLRVELEDFSQVFDRPDASHAVIVARATIVDVAKRALQAQKSFSVERAANAATAEGGVGALTAAGDDLIEDIVAWVATTLAQNKK